LWHWSPSAVGSWWRQWGCCIRQSIAVPVEGLWTCIWPLMLSSCSSVSILNSVL
jgi:hypothetical protein